MPSFIAIDDATNLHIYRGWSQVHSFKRKNSIYKNYEIYSRKEKIATTRERVLHIALAIFSLGLSLISKKNRQIVFHGKQFIEFARIRRAPVIQNSRNNFLPTNLPPTISSPQRSPSSTPIIPSPVVSPSSIAPKFSQLNLTPEFSWATSPQAPFSEKPKVTISEKGAFSIDNSFTIRNQVISNKNIVVNNEIIIDNNKITINGKKASACSPTSRIEN